MTQTQESPAGGGGHMYDKVIYRENMEQTSCLEP